MKGKILIYKCGGALLAIILTFMPFAGYATTHESEGLWAGNSIVIDGNIDDWEGLPTTFFEDENLVLGVRNDSTFLYLLLRTNDPRTVGIIRRMGMQLWLDAKGKKKKDLGLRFQGGPSPEEIRESGMMRTDDSGRGMPDGMSMRRDNMPEPPGDILAISDSRLELQERIAADGKNGPQFRYSLGQGFCNYEIKIPLEAHRVDYYGMDAEPGKKISVGIEIGGRPQMGDRMRPSGGMSGGFPDDGMSRGGMRDGGRPPGGMGGRMEAPEKKEIWLKTKLAVSAEQEN